MSQQGALLQGFNNELVKYIEQLRQKKEELNRVIREEEQQRVEAEKEVKRATEKLDRLNQSLNRKVALKDEYEKTLAGAEASFVKLVESSRSLLTVVKQEAETLNQTSGGS